MQGKDTSDLQIQQMMIGNDGRLIIDPRGPRTWDGEPMYCEETVREGLFDPTAFRQFSGQMALETDEDE